MAQVWTMQGQQPQTSECPASFPRVCVAACQALRSAFDHFSSSHSFEVVLREADTAADSSSSGRHTAAWGSVKHGKQVPAGGAGGDAGAGQATERLRTVLLRRPAVFTLAVVWESPKVRPTITCVNCVFMFMCRLCRLVVESVCSW
jgi:hypothetical protein